MITASDYYTTARTRRRARHVANGLTVEGKPRVRPPSRWPLLDKQDHAAYMRNWRAVGGSKGKDQR